MKYYEVGKLAKLVIQSTYFITLSSLRNHDMITEAEHFKVKQSRYLSSWNVKFVDFSATLNLLTK